MQRPTKPRSKKSSHRTSSRKSSRKHSSRKTRVIDGNRKHVDLQCSLGHSEPFTQRCVRIFYCHVNAVVVAFHTTMLLIAIVVFPALYNLPFRSCFLLAIFIHFTSVRTYPSPNRSRLAAPSRTKVAYRLPALHAKVSSVKSHVPKVQ